MDILRGDATTRCHPDRPNSTFPASPRRGRSAAVKFTKMGWKGNVYQAPPAPSWASNETKASMGRSLLSGKPAERQTTLYIPRQSLPQRIKCRVSALSERFLTQGPPSREKVRSHPRRTSRFNRFANPATRMPDRARPSPAFRRSFNVRLLSE